MAATLLADGEYELTNVPDIADVGDHGRTARRRSASTIVAPEPRRARCSPTPATSRPVAPYELVERIRASINVLGPLLTRCGHVRLSLPGGDDFGARPIDMHVAGLEAMGATFKFSHGYLEAYADRLHGADITSTSRASARPRTCSPPPCSPTATRRSTTPRASPRSSTSASSCGDGRRHRRASARRTLVIDGVEQGSLRRRATTRRSPDRIQAATYIAAVRRRRR